MKKKLLLVLLALVSSGADLRVDHVTFAGRDLKHLQAQFAALGIRTEYGGKHTGGLTEMALASFGDGSYVELIAAIDPKAGAAGHYWGKFIDENAGPCAWAIRVDKLEGTESGRTRADGVQLKWRSRPIGSENQGTFFPFMIQDLTNRALRAFPSGKPTMPEWRGVVEVHIAVRNLEKASDRYRRQFSLGAPKIAGREALFPGTPILLVGGDTERLDKFGEGVFAFVIAGPGGERHLIR
jgi:Glyoxalase-like domain